jgi:hypothetical protein
VIKKSKYALNQIRKNYKNTEWWRSRFIGNILGPSLQRVNDYPNGINYMDKDWDNLMILDAARSDIFEELINTEQFDQYESIWSLGSTSTEWMRKTFSNREFPDTVYVSANPWISKIASNSFHKIYHVWAMENVEGEGLNGHFDPLDSQTETSSDTNLRTKTVYPRKLNEVAQKAIEENPQKRIIVHYFQPHAPIIADSNRDRLQEPMDIYPSDIKKNKISTKDMIEKYKNNLIYTYYKSSELAQKIGGKTAFTSDHGECFGTQLIPFIKLYGHQKNIYIPELRSVPWAIKQFGDRRNISEGQINSNEINSEEVNERLKSLGYKPE